MAPSGNCTPGKIRAPRELTLSARTPAADLRAATHATTGREDAVSQAGALADLSPIEDDSPLDRAAGANRHVAAEHRQAAHVRAFGHADAPLKDRRGDHATVDMGVRVHR